jgi:hypothetical protein
MLIHIKRDPEKINVSENVFQRLFIYAIGLVGDVDLLQLFIGNVGVEVKSYCFPGVSKVFLDKFFENEFLGVSGILEELLEFHGRRNGVIKGKIPILRKEYKVRCYLIFQSKCTYFF